MKLPLVFKIKFPAIKHIGRTKILAFIYRNQPYIRKF